MKNLRIYLVTAVLVFSSCASQKRVDLDDDFSADPAVTSNGDMSGEGTSFEDTSSPAASDSFAEFDQGSATDAPSTDSFAEFDQGTATDAPGTDAFAEFDQSQPSASGDVAQSDVDLEAELNSVGTSTPPAPEIVQDSTVQPDVVADQPVPSFEEPSPQPEVVADSSEPEVSEPAPAIVGEVLSQINSVDYKSNASGGTVMIAADQPLQFTKRVNSATNQFIVEVQNSVIPKKLKRSLNTKDMASSIGSVDIYQKANSKISRFVIQLRPGASEPLVQPEGNSLLIIGGSNPQYVAAKSTQSENSSAQIESVGQSSADPGSADPSLASEGIMSSNSLEDFLMSNNQFYGKKISIETNNLEVKEAIKFIAEESGVNMIMDEGLEGTVSLKLRQVPWDQALVLLLKSKKLAYKRQGNVLRIAKISDIQKEEAEGIRLKEAKANSDPLVVKRFFIGYAEIKDLEVKIKDFLYATATSGGGAAAGTTAAAGAGAAEANRSSSRARVISDARTSSLIVTDTAENMLKIEKLIAALDTQPQQVLIEGKVIEAREGFTRQVGVKWKNDSTTAVGTNSGSLSITPDLGSTQAILSSAVTWGQLDILGNLTATLQLGEREDKVRILSSPRITVLSSQTANISQTSGMIVPKVETQTPTTGGANVITVTKDVVQVGVILKVTPQVSNEGTVTLDLDIERSFKAQFDAPAPDRRNAKTKVIVKSGQTAVIGGIFETTAIDGSSGVPGLRDIPILGFLFKGQVQQKDKNELVIFVTPRILQPIVGDKRSSTFE